MFFYKHGFIKTDDEGSFKNSLYRAPIFITGLAILGLMLGLYLVFFIPFQITGGTGFDADGLLMSIIKNVFNGSLHPVLILGILIINYIQIFKTIKAIDQKNRFEKNFKDLVELNKKLSIGYFVFSLLTAATQNKYFQNNFGDLMVLAIPILLYLNLNSANNSLRTKDYTFKKTLR